MNQNQNQNQSQKKKQFSLEDFVGDRDTVCENERQKTLPSLSVSPLDIEKEIEETNNPFRKIWLIQESMREKFNECFK